MLVFSIIIKIDRKMYMKYDYDVQFENLLKRLEIEFNKKDKSGVYGETQILLAYNSNRIEGSTLTYNQTSSIFDTGTIVNNEEIVRTKDIEEMNGHFVMFNNMLKNYKATLSEDLIKSYHYDLKFGVFEDRANGYAVGEYKTRGNRVSDIITCDPEEVSSRMQALLKKYNSKSDIQLEDIALFHVEYEKIHPFQDGNGRTGRIIMFKECLKNRIFPFIIEDINKGKYYAVLNKAQKGEIEPFVNFLMEEQKAYYDSIIDLIDGN